MKVIRSAKELLSVLSCKVNAHVPPLDAVMCKYATHPLAELAPLSTLVPLVLVVRLAPVANATPKGLMDKPDRESNPVCPTTALTLTRTGPSPVLG